MRLPRDWAPRRAHWLLATPFCLALGACTGRGAPRTEPSTPDDSASSADLLESDQTPESSTPNAPASRSSHTAQEGESPEHPLKARCPGTPDQCLLLAIREYSGSDSSPPDRERAFSLAEDACQNGFATACNRLGTWYEGAGDGRHAVDAWSRGCDLGFGLSCRNAGRALSEHARFGVDADWPRALALLSRACSQGICIACLDLAELHSDGRGVPVDKARQSALRTRGEALGCVH